MKNAVCCDNDSCQSIYQRELRNAKRREKDNSTYKIHINRLSNYIGQQKIKLSPAVLDAPELVERFDKQRKIFMQLMRDKIGEYEAENRLPDDELSAFYDKIQQDVVRFAYSLEALVR